MKELDVDSIGEQYQPLTEEEQLAVSDFLLKLKEKNKEKVKKSKLRK